MDPMGIETTKHLLRISVGSFPSFQLGVKFPDGTLPFFFPAHLVLSVGFHRLMQLINALKPFVVPIGTTGGCRPTCSSEHPEGTVATGPTVGGVQNLHGAIALPESNSLPLEVWRFLLETRFFWGEMLDFREFLTL